MTGITLFILDRFKFLFVLLKVDYPKMRKIIEVKLTTDNRRMHLKISARSRSKAVNNSFTRSLIAYMLFGLLVGLEVIFIPSLALNMLLFFTFVMSITSMTMISDFTFILVDTTDNAVIFPRPVDNRTLLTARILHIVIYLISIIFSLSLATVIIGTIKYGPLFFPVIFCIIVFAGIFTVFFTCIFYMILFKVCSPERFNDIIYVFQALMTILYIIGFLVISTVLRYEVFYTVDFQAEWWYLSLPPAWFAITTASVITGELTPITLTIMSTALIIPIACMGIVVKFFSTNFGEKLTGLENAGQSAEIKNTLKKGPVYYLSVLFNHTSLERTIFRMIWQITGRDRKYKLRVYPGFGNILIFTYLIIIHFSSESDLSIIFKRLSTTSKFIPLIYLSGITVMAAVPLLIFSDNYRAAWLYRVIPVKKPGLILIAAVKCVIIKYIMPSYIILSGFIFVIWGPGKTADILLGLFNLILFTILTAFLWNKVLPLSIKPIPGELPGRTVKSLLIMLLFVLLAVGHHYLGKYFSWGLWPAMAIMGGINFLLMRRYKNVVWDRLDK